MKCRACGKEILWGARRDKTYCDAVCRKRWQRRRDKLWTAKHEAYGCLARIRELAKKYPDLHSEIIELLKWMQPEIKDLLHLARDTEQQERIAMLSDFRRRRNL